MAIEAKHYGETRSRLQLDPLVQLMAQSIPTDALSSLHHDGTPTFAFMQAANAKYRELGGADGGHIGAVAEAVIALIEARS